jgi:hypothetical protein
MSETLDNYFAPEAQQETLSKQQEQILARVLEIIEKNPELNKDLADTFKANAEATLSDPNKFNLISELIDTNTQKALSIIEDTYGKDGDKEKALRDSREAIQKATIMKLT